MPWNFLYSQSRTARLQCDGAPSCMYIAFSLIPSRFTSGQNCSCNMELKVNDHRWQFGRKRTDRSVIWTNCKLRRLLRVKSLLDKEQSKWVLGALQYRWFCRLTALSRWKCASLKNASEWRHCWSSPIRCNTSVAKSRRLAKPPLTAPERPAPWKDATSSPSEFFAQWFDLCSLLRVIRMLSELKCEDRF